MYITVVSENTDRFIEDQAFRRRMICLLPPPRPSLNPSVSLTGHTQEDLVRETTC
jgi:hypothetical protein